MGQQSADMSAMLVPGVQQFCCEAAHGHHGGAASWRQLLLEGSSWICRCGVPLCVCIEGLAAHVLVGGWGSLMVTGRVAGSSWEVVDFSKAVFVSLMLV